MSVQEKESPLPPPYHAQEDDIKLPAVVDISIRGGKIPTLEPLPSLLSSPPQHPLDPPSLDTVEAQRGSGPAHQSQSPTTTSTRLELPSVPKSDPSQSSPTANSMEGVNRDQSVSMEDPDDRMAAEALCGLGKAAESARKTRSPSGYEQPLKYYPMNIEHTTSANSDGEPEPLLSLLTSSHPWLGGTINGSLSAYSSTKSHSPRFLRYSADFVERNIGSAMANTVGSVGRKTGVEDSLRRYLTRPAGDMDHIDPEILEQEGSNKRRRISNEDDEFSADGFSMHRTTSGHTSIETLPLYDENRSPAYEDTESGRQAQQRSPASRSWSTQLMISTSGLGAALNDTSLRSLKYVLQILRSANSRVRKLMDALKKVLKDYSSSRGGAASEQTLEDGTLPVSGNDPNHDPQHQTSSNLTSKINHLNSEIWNTLKSVVNTVSKYTGGALPENASVIVRWQLMSVPRRWQRASNAPAFEHIETVGDNSKLPAQDEKEALNSANRMLAFAVEGIDMMEQVGGVVDSTILSADRWLEKMGRRKEIKLEEKTKFSGEEPEPQTLEPSQEENVKRKGEEEEAIEMENMVEQQSDLGENGSRKGSDTKMADESALTTTDSSTNMTTTAMDVVGVEDEMAVDTSS